MLEAIVKLIEAGISVGDEILQIERIKNVYVINNSYRAKDKVFDKSEEAAQYFLSIKDPIRTVWGVL